MRQVIKMLKCENCRSHFMRPREDGSCPFCGRQTVEVEKKMSDDFKFTGVIKDGKFQYMDSKGREKWLLQGPEDVKTQTTPKPAEQKQAEKEIATTNNKLLQKQKQANYRKRRYQLQKMGKWKGSMDKSLK